MQVTVAYSPASRLVREWEVALASGATLAEALTAAGVLQEFPAISLMPLELGVWGNSALPSDLAKDGDRIEIYRALRVDPKVARRERFGRQGAKGTGLFAKSRAGGKQGY